MKTEEKLLFIYMSIVLIVMVLVLAHSNYVFSNFLSEDISKLVHHIQSIEVETTTFLGFITFLHVIILHKLEKLENVLREGLNERKDCV